MVTNKEKCEEVCKILLSLLLSRPNAIPVVTLDRDYYKEEGEHIPWNSLGYSNLAEFLKDFPERFMVEESNGVPLVHGIPSNKSKHVSSLVARQKKPKFTPPRFHSPSLNRELYNMPRNIPYNMPRNIPYNVPHNMPYNVPHNMPHMPHNVPHNVPYNVPYNVPHNMPYNVPYNMPRNVPQRPWIRVPADILHDLIQYVNNYGSTGVSLQHALLLIKKQLPHVELSVQELRKQLRELPHQLRLDCEIIYPACINANGCQQSAPSAKSIPLSVPDAETVCAGGDEESDDMEDRDAVEFIPAGCTTSNRPKPRTSERLAANFMQNTHEQNKTSNCDNNTEYLATSSVGNKEIDDVASLINERMKMRLKQLIEKHPKGIWCAELPDTYQKEYNVSLNYVDLGFTSVREFVSHLPNIFYMARPNFCEDFLLLCADKRPTVPDQETETKPEVRPSSCEQYKYCGAQYNDDQDKAPIPPDVSPTITRRFVPDDVMNYNDSVKHILVTDLQSTKQFLEVYVVEVFNPSFFWIQLRENKKGFDNFMRDLEEFYIHDSEKYVIPKVALQKGLNCACIYTGIWHRGIIKTVKPDYRVTVLFYDYGTLKTYAPEEVYFLHKRFSSLPAQAIPCGLYNVRPCVGDRWKKSVNDQFIDKAVGLLAATIKSVDPSNNSMMVILTDTTEDEQTHINDWLVHEKLARCGVMSDVVDMAGIMKYVVNTVNQLPSYCFAEESLMSESRCQATSTEEIHEIPLVLPGQTLRNNYMQKSPAERPSMKSPPMKSPPMESPPMESPPMELPLMGLPPMGLLLMGPSSMGPSSMGPSSMGPSPMGPSPMGPPPMGPSLMRPPPGFTPLCEQPDLSKMSTNFHNGYPSGSTPNERVPSFSDANASTNPFLDDQQFDVMPNDIAKSLFAQIWTENLQLQFKLTGMFNKMLECTPLNKNVFDNHMKVQHQLNKVLKSFEQAMVLNNDDLIVNPPLPTSNITKEMTQNDIGSAQSAPINTNSDIFASQNSAKPANAWLSNVTAGTSKKYWSQFNPHVPLSPIQIQSSTVPSPAPSTFSTYRTPADSFSNPDKNVSLMKSTSPRLLTNCSISNNDRASLGFLSTANSEPAIVIKETNPFKMYLTGNTKVPDTQDYWINNDTGSTYFSVENIHNHAPKMEAANVYANVPTMNNSLVSAGHVDVDYCPRVVYEAGPVMYNTQKKQADLETRQNTYNCELNNAQNAIAKLELCGKDLPSQFANDMTALHLRQNDEGYVTRSPTDYMQDNSPPIISDEPYQQDVQTNIPRPVSTHAWKKIEIPERWINQKFQNDIPLKDLKRDLITLQDSMSESPTNSLPSTDWNCNNIKESRENLSEMIDTQVFQFDSDQEKSMGTNAYIWNTSSCTENQKLIQHNNTTFTLINNTFVFHKIDSVQTVSFIFHIQQEGWILVHEFVETFTHLKLCSNLMAMLEAMNIKMTFKEIERFEYPVQFLQLDSFSLNVPRDSEKRISSINLISLPNALSLLLKLKIVSREEVDSAFKRNEFVDGSILRNLWMLLFAYRDLRRRIEQCVNYNT